LQIENLRVTRDDLFNYLSQVRVDPAFAAIVDWAKARKVDISIVSNSFLPLIHHILLTNGIDVVPVPRIGLSGSPIRTRTNDSRIAAGENSCFRLITNVEPMPGFTWMP